MEHHLRHQQMRQLACCVSLDMACGACSAFTKSTTCIAWRSRVRRDVVCWTTALCLHSNYVVYIVSIRALLGFGFKYLFLVNQRVKSWESWEWRQVTSNSWCHMFFKPFPEGRGISDAPGHVATRANTRLRLEHAGPTLLTLHNLSLKGICRNVMHHGVRSRIVADC